MISNLVNISNDEIKNLIFEKSNLKSDCTINNFIDSLSENELSKINNWADSETEQYFITELKKFDENKTIEHYKNMYAKSHVKYQMAIDLLYYCI